eukprot:1114501-Amphidinium_carterae.1
MVRRITAARNKTNITNLVHLAAVGCQILNRVMICCAHQAKQASQQQNCMIRSANTLGVFHLANSVTLKFEKTPSSLSHTVTDVGKTNTIIQASSNTARSAATQRPKAHLITTSCAGASTL